MVGIGVKRFSRITFEIHNIHVTFGLRWSRSDEAKSLAHVRARLYADSLANPPKSKVDRGALIVDRGSGSSTKLPLPKPNSRTRAKESK